MLREAQHTRSRARQNPAGTHHKAGARGQNRRQLQAFRRRPCPGKHHHPQAPKGLSNSGPNLPSSFAPFSLMCKYLTGGRGDEALGSIPEPTSSSSRRLLAMMAAPDTEFWGFWGLKLSQAAAVPQPTRDGGHTPAAHAGLHPGGTSVSTDGAQSMARCSKDGKPAGGSLRAVEVCLCLGMEWVPGPPSLLSRLQQCHIHQEQRLALGRDWSGR